jgi:hypothetical protein
LNDFIINVLPVQGPTIPIWFPFIGGSQINSPLIGSFLGVVLGFLINYGFQYWRNRNDRIYYMKAITAEIDFCISCLNHSTVFLSTDGWDAALNSGVLRHFEHDQVARLSKAYHGIKRFNVLVDYWNQGMLTVSAIETRQSRLLQELKDLKDLLNPSVPLIKADEAGAYYSTRAMYCWQFWK